MSKHLLGLTLFVLIVGVTLYLYTPRGPVTQPPAIAVTRLPVRANDRAVVLDLRKREANISFTLSGEMPDTLWARVEFSNPDDGAPHWTTPPIHIAPYMADYHGQFTVDVFCEKCEDIAPRANYYARVMFSTAPYATPLPDDETDKLVPVLLKHR